MNTFELATRIAIQALISNAGVDATERDAFSAIAVCNAPSFKAGETLREAIN